MASLIDKYDIKWYVDDNMTVQTTQMTKVYCSWGDPLEKSDIEDLNRDLAEMDLPLRIVYSELDDGWEMTFIKDKD